MTTAEAVAESLTKAPSLAQLVRERLELSNAADPSAIVDDLLADLDPETLQEAARVALRHVAVAQARQMRNASMAPPAPKGSAKWDAAGATVRQHPEIFAARIVIGYVAGDHSRPIWKFLGDCTKVDLAGADEIERVRGEALIRRADRYRALSRKLRAGQVVRDLPVEKVEAIFNA